MIKEMKSENKFWLCLFILVLGLWIYCPVFAENYSGTNDLGGNTRQTDNGAVRVLYVGEGTATSTTTTTTMPVSVGVLGAGASSVGGNVSYVIGLSNPNRVSNTYNLSVSGLNESWYSLSGESGVLSPREALNVSLIVSIPFDCGLAGTYVFNVSTGESSSQGSLDVSAGPFIFGLLPVDAVTVSSLDVLFSRRMSSDSTSILYIKSDNETEYMNISGGSGLFHSIVAENLSRNAGYSWYVESCSACGCMQSENRTFHIDNGVTFTQRTYSYTVERDYNQHTSVAIRNTDALAHTLLLEAANPYEDLIVGFTGNGSVDRNITVQLGETANIDFMVHAQDAVLGEYDNPISLKKSGCR
jgi:hypothetical protein